MKKERKRIEENKIERKKKQEWQKFIKAKLKKSEEQQTNIDKYRVAVYKILQNIISLKQKFDLPCMSFY